MVTSDESEMITTEEAAKMLNCGTSTLRKWRIEGSNLPFHKLARKCVRYDKRDVVAFIASCRTEPVRGHA